MTNKSKMIIGIIAVIALLWIFSGRGLKDTTMDFVEAMYDGDAKKIVSLMSDECLEETMARKGAETKKVLINEYKEICKQNDESMKSRYGDKWKYKAEFIDSYENEDGTVTAVVEVTYSGKKWFSDKEDSETMEIELVKQGRKWYVNGV